MTEKLYMESIDACYLKSFDAKVIAIDNQKIILDRTLFYPLGGGQNWDIGTISGETGKINAGSRKTIYLIFVHQFSFGK